MKSKPVQLVVLERPSEIAKQVDTWRAGYGQTEPSEQAGQWLRERVWLPLERHLDDAKSVLIASDGALGKLAWAALPNRLPAGFLVEEFAITVLPFSAALPRVVGAQLRQTPPDRLLAVGDVDYGAVQAGAEAKAAAGLSRAPREKAALGFAPLDGTRDELKALERIYGQSGTMTTLAKSEATEAALRREVARHEHLHLATHGFFASPHFRSALDRSALDQQFGNLVTDQSLSGYHPNLLSGIVLAGANRPIEQGDDGILTAEEVQTLDCRRVEMVVLSACETGLGKAAGGEGLLGLQRAFQVAGARSVVASLWKVDDDATRLFMTQLYANLWQKKMTRAEALRQAQLTMLLGYEPATRRLRAGFDERPIDEKALQAARAALKPGQRRLSPEYWAAFVLSGDWR
jgi:CHAT domain-containing protein